MSLKLKVRSQLLEEQAREVAASGGAAVVRPVSAAGRVGYWRMIAVRLAESGDSKGSEFV